MAEQTDPLTVLLQEAAEQRAAGTARPSLLPQPAPPARARARARVLAPVLAAAAVVAVAGAATLLPGLVDRTPPVPGPPVLGVLAPPDAVARRLAAPLGHTAGPPVPEAQVLAVAPAQDGRPGLQTVGVVRERPDDPGRVDRCEATYTDDADPAPDACAYRVLPDGAQDVGARPVDPVEVSVHGRPGRTWLQGSVPAGTAAVELRAPDRATVVVPVAAVDGFGERPRFVAWWPRTGTDLVAVDREGTALARSRVPDPEPAAPRPGDPELGTVETPLDVRVDMMAPDPRDVQHSPRPARVDVLDRVQVREGVVLYTLGYLTETERCTVTRIEDTTGDETRPPQGGSSSCLVDTEDATPGPPKDLSDASGHRLSVSRAFSAGTGRPEEQLLTGRAPAGTVRVRLEAPGRTADLVAHDAGDRWGHAAYFSTPWPSSLGTRVTAFDADGKQLETTESGDLDPKRLSPEFNATLADCYRTAGWVVKETPQGSAGPAYEFAPPAGSSAATRRADDDRCTAEAERAVGLR